ncbi:MAG: cell division protein FtsQ/DivIB [Solirubrobacteraceae bacterium]
MIKYIILIKSIFFLLLFIFLFSFTHKRGSKKESTLVLIESNDQKYVKNKSIIEFIYRNNTLLYRKKLNKIDLLEIEKKLDNFNFIKKSEVFYLPNGNVYIKIKEENPILRIKTNRKEYYLTNENKTIALSSIFTPEVLIIEGKVKESEHEKLIQLLNYINDDNLLRTHIVGVKKGGENFYIFMTNMQHSIEFGSLYGFKEKFEKLKLFYNEYLNKQPVGKYKKISLRFNNQIVASK